MVETYPRITQSWYNWEVCNERKMVFFCNRLSCQSTYLLIGKKSASSSTVPKRKNLFSVNWSKYIQVCQDEWPQSPKYTHKNTQKHKLSLTHKHTHPLTLTHSHTPTTPTRRCSHIHTHIHTHTHTYTHTYIHTHTHTHTRTGRPIFSSSFRFSISVFFQMSLTFDL